MRQFIISLFMLSVLCTPLSVATQVLPVYTISTPYKGEGFSLTRMDDNRFYMFTGPGTMHFDSSGQILWYKRYINIDYGRGMIRTNSRGGLNILLHSTGSVFGNGDLIFFDQDSDGNCYWVKIFGTAAAEIPAGFTETPSGNSVIASTMGTQGEDGIIMLMAIDSGGNQLWQRKYSTEFGSLSATSIKEYNNKLIISGILNETDGIILRTGAGGSKEWTVGISGCLVYDIAPDPADGKIYFCGSSMNPGDSSVTDIIVGAIDTAGSLIWSRRVGYSSPDNQGDTANARCIYFDPAGQKIVIAGSITRNFMPQRNTQALLMMFSTDGTLLNQEIAGGAGEDYFSSIVPGNDGSFITCGFSNSFGNNFNTLLAGISADGQPLCVNEEILCIADSVAVMIFDPEIVADTLTVDVSTFCLPPVTDSFLILDLCLTSRPESTGNSEKELTIYPNPVGEQLMLTLNSPDISSCIIMICDIYGQVLYRKRIHEKHHVINTAALSSGQYYLIVSSGEIQSVNKFIKY